MTAGKILKKSRFELPETGSPDNSEGVNKIVSQDEATKGSATASTVKFEWSKKEGLLVTYFCETYEGVIAKHSHYEFDNESDAILGQQEWERNLTTTLA